MPITLFGQLQYVLSLNLGCVFHGSLIMRVDYKSFADTKTAEYFAQQVFVTELPRDVRQIVLRQSAFFRQ